jgi:hypothetical protein
MLIGQSFKMFEESDISDNETHNLQLHARPCLSLEQVHCMLKEVSHLFVKLRAILDTSMHMRYRLQRKMTICISNRHLDNPVCVCVQQILSHDEASDMIRAMLMLPKRLQAEKSDKRQQSSGQSPSKRLKTTDSDSTE